MIVHHLMALLHLIVQLHKLLIPQSIHFIEHPTDANYLWVTKNGIKLSVATDFTIENNKLKILSNIGATDLIVVHSLVKMLLNTELVGKYGMIF